MTTPRGDNPRAGPIAPGPGAGAPAYGRRALESWAGRLAGLFGAGEDVYVYFNNDERACAVGDARRFARLVEKAGLVPTRVGG